MKKASYHNHSLFSDGKNSILEIIESAKAAGLEEVGLSDHYMIEPNQVSYEWSLHPKTAPTVAHLADYVAEVRRAAALHDENHFKVRLGMEVDFFDESGWEGNKSLSAYPFDYLIGSVHFVDGFLVDLLKECWHSIPVEKKESIIGRYWELIEKLAQSRLFDIVGHIDLYKKFAIFPIQDHSLKISHALDAIKASEMTVELNTAGWHAPCQEQYPSIDILKECLKREIPFVISADSHRASDVGQDFQKANQLLHSLGKPIFASYSKRERVIKKSN